MAAQRALTQVHRRGQLAQGGRPAGAHPQQAAQGLDQRRRAVELRQRLLGQLLVLPGEAVVAQGQGRVQPRPVVPDHVGVGAEHHLSAQPGLPGARVRRLGTAQRHFGDRAGRRHPEQVLDMGGDKGVQGAGVHRRAVQRPDRQPLGAGPVHPGHRDAVGDQRLKAHREVDHVVQAGGGLHQQAEYPQVHGLRRQAHVQADGRVTAEPLGGGPQPAHRRHGHPATGVGGQPGALQARFTQRQVAVQAPARQGVEHGQRPGGHGGGGERRHGQWPPAGGRLPPWWPGPAALACLALSE